MRKNYECLGRTSDLVTPPCVYPHLTAAWTILTAISRYIISLGSRKRLPPGLPELQQSLQITCRLLNRTGCKTRGHGLSKRRQDNIKIVDQKSIIYNKEWLRNPGPWYLQKKEKKNKPERRTPLDSIAIGWEMKNLNVLSLNRFIGNMKKRRLEGCVHDIWLVWLLVGKETKGTLF